MPKVVDGSRADLRRSNDMAMLFVALDYGVWLVKVYADSRGEGFANEWLRVLEHLRYGGYCADAARYSHLIPPME